MKILNEMIHIFIGLTLICSTISFIFSEMASMTSLIIVWSMIILPLTFIVVVINRMFLLLKNN